MLQCLQIDEVLCEQSYVYKSFRAKGSIRPMVVHTVRPDTFKELREFTIATTTASANQYKIPRVLKRKEALDFIMEKVVKDKWMKGSSFPFSHSLWVGFFFLEILSSYFQI